MKKGTLPHYDYASFSPEQEGPEQLHITIPTATLASHRACSDVRKRPPIKSLLSIQAALAMSKNRWLSGSHWAVTLLVSPGLGMCVTCCRGHLWEDGHGGCYIDKLKTTDNCRDYSSLYNLCIYCGQPLWACVLVRSPWNVIVSLQREPLEELQTIPLFSGVFYGFLWE